jgi:hypothetical protein
MPMQNIMHTLTHYHARKAIHRAFSRCRIRFPVNGRGLVRREAGSEPAEVFANNTRKLISGRQRPANVQALGVTAGETAKALRS